MAIYKKKIPTFCLPPFEEPIDQYLKNLSATSNSDPKVPGFSNCDHDSPPWIFRGFFLSKKIHPETNENTSQNHPPRPRPSCHTHEWRKCPDSKGSEIPPFHERYHIFRLQDPEQASLLASILNGSHPTHFQPPYLHWSLVPEKFSLSKTFQPFCF